MSSNKKMIVIFENLELVHLEKDVGVLPLALQTNEKWDISLYSTLKDFTQSDYEKSIKLKFFTKFKNRKWNKYLLFLNILRQASRLDYLMIYHDHLDKFILLYLCKLINPSLLTYAKLDKSELGAYSIINHTPSNNFLKKILRNKIYGSIDLFTVETKKVYEMIKDLPRYYNKLYYLPNGFYAESPYDWSVPKEKMIISVGRIGTPPKNNELLLSAIEQLENIGEYHFYFIGPVESSFQTRVDALLLRREDLRDKIILTGNISDKEKLYEYYKRAEILCFTSSYEGFSLVMTEALYFGCYLVSTDLAAVYDLTENGKYGEIVKVNQALIHDCTINGITDIVQYTDSNFEAILSSTWFSQASKQLSNSLQSVIDSKVDIDTASDYLAQNTYENFNWITIAKKLRNLFENAKRGN